jgi:type IV secretion system protein VirD4
MTSPLYRLPNSTLARRRTVAVLTFASLCACAFVAGAVAASRVAFAVGYPRALGEPLFVPLPSLPRVIILLAAALALLAAAYTRRWLVLPALALGYLALVFATAYPIYPPSSFITARHAFAGTRYDAVTLDATRWGLAALAAIALVCAPALRRLTFVRTGDLHGSARFATPTEIAAADFVLDDPQAHLTQSFNVPIGTLATRGHEQLVRVAGDVHFLAFAPPGAGKTTSLVIPATQDFAGNVLVLDVKGELAAATAGYRHQHGSRILLLDPSRDEPHLARYNPLLSVRPWPHDVQDVTELAQLLVPDSPGSDPFWKQSARTLLEGVLLHVLYTSPQKTLAACYRLLCDPEHPIEDQFEWMLKVEHDPAGTDWKQHPRVRSAARTFLDMPAITRGGVVANAQASLSPYSDPILEAATCTSDFSLEDLYLRRDKPVSLYLVIDPNSLQRLSNHIRIVVSQVTAALTRKLPTEVDRRPVLMILDEFPTFGKMTVVETALAYLRGYGVQVYIVVQHIGQLIAAYGKTEGISPNCALHIAFAPAHLETAEQLSKTAGQQTVAFERGSVSRTTPLSASASFQQTDSGRALLSPDEIMRLPKGHALVIRTGMRPFIVQPRPYFSDSLRAAAARLPVPRSEPTSPSFLHWLDRPIPARPIKGKREARIRATSILGPQEPYQ